MRIVILGPSWPYRGGIAAFTDRLDKALRVAGHDVQVITYTMLYPGFLFPGRTQYSESVKPAGMRVQRSLNTINPLSWIRTARRIRKAAPDVVLFTFWMPLMGPAFGTIARLLRMQRQTVCQLSLLHNVIPHERRPGDRMLTSYFLRTQDAFIAMSDSVEEDLRTFIPDALCELNPHPIYDHFGERTERLVARRKLGYTTDGTYLLFFGLIREYKGLDLLLRAMGDERLKTLDVRLMVVGEFYADRQEYLDIIAEEGIVDRVLLVPEFVPDERVADYFNAADIVVQPYKTATQSGVTQVAYHFEKPMLVTDVGGLAEIVPHGKAGYVVAPEPAAIADALVDFVNLQRYSAMVEGSRDEKQKYSWDGMVESVARAASILH